MTWKKKGVPISRVGIVYAPQESGGPYAVAVMSRNMDDPIAGARTASRGGRRLHLRSRHRGPVRRLSSA